MLKELSEAMAAMGKSARAANWSFRGLNAVLERQKEQDRARDRWPHGKRPSGGR